MPTHPAGPKALRHLVPPTVRDEANAWPELLSMLPARVDRPSVDAGDRELIALAAADELNEGHSRRRRDT
jgi:hypothetical protein